EASRHHLRHQRDALGDMLILAENEDQERHEHAACGDTKEAGEQAAGEAGYKSADDVSRAHPRSLRLTAMAAFDPATFASSHNASISSSVASSSERPLAASARSIWAKRFSNLALAPRRA